MDELKSEIIEKYNKIWAKYYNRIYAYCYTKLQNPADVDDCIQNTFSALYNKMLNGDEIISPGAWLYDCARKQACKINEKARREIPGCNVGNINIIEQITYYDNYFVNEKTDDEIEALKSTILRKLSRDEQTLLNKVYVQKMKVCEIAKKSKIKPNTLSHRLCRIKKKIQKYINEFNCY